MARCVIVSACPVSPALAGLLRADDYLIACDAGYHNCEALGRRPDAVVGTSIRPPCPVAAPGEDLVVLPHVKDDTDTEYAASWPPARATPKFCCWGAWGAAGWNTPWPTSVPASGWNSGGVRAVLQNERSRVTYLLPARPAPTRGGTTSTCRCSR